VTSFTTVTALTLGLVLAVVVINAIMKALLVVLAKKERPLAESQLAGTTLWKIFVAQYINTALVPLLINFKLIEGVVDGRFNDLTTGWYISVGAPMILTLATNAISANLTPVVMVCVQKAKMCCQAKSASKMHQEELLDVYTYPEFNLSVRFSLAVNTVWCVMTYSSGMPILNWVALLYFVIAYFADKYTLLRGSRNPPQYSTQPGMIAFKFCLLAGIVHLLFAIWIFGDPNIFPSGSLASVLGAEYGVELPQDFGNVTVTGDERSFGEEAMASGFIRLTSTNTVFLTILLVLTVGTLTVKTVLNLLLGNAVENFVMGLLKCLRRIFCCGRGGSKVAAEDDEGDVALQTTYTKALDLMSTRQNPSYKMEKNEKYKPIFEAMRSTAAFADEKKGSFAP